MMSASPALAQQSAPQPQTLITNVSIFDVASNDELHQLLSGLPLFPYMQIKVKPLANHPSAIVQE